MRHRSFVYRRCSKSTCLWRWSVTLIRSASVLTGARSKSVSSQNRPLEALTPFLSPPRTPSRSPQPSWHDPVFGRSSTNHRLQWAKDSRLLCNKLSPSGPLESDPRLKISCRVRARACRPLHPRQRRQPSCRMRPGFLSTRLLDQSQQPFPAPGAHRKRQNALHSQRR